MKICIPTDEKIVSIKDFLNRETFFKMSNTEQISLGCLGAVSYADKFKLAEKSDGCGTFPAKAAYMPT